MTIERIKELYEQMEISSEPTIGEIRNAIKIITGFVFSLDKFPNEKNIYKDFYDDDKNDWYEIHFECLPKTNKVIKFNFNVSPKTRYREFVKRYPVVK